MNTSNKQNNSDYFNGGFAEIVSEPSEITFYYLRQWFSGKNSIGEAMDMLNLPYEEIPNSLLEMVDGELMVNLKIEEQTLYKNTLFSYAKQNTPSDAPKLTVNWLKVLNPLTWLGTSKIVIAQSKWIANPTETAQQAAKWVTEIPEVSTKDHMNAAELSVMLQTEVWPVVLSIGIVAEFYQQYLSTQLKQSFKEVEPWIAEEISKKDWFFRSLCAQKDVKDKSLTLEEYIHTYGMRSDKDYELTSPRWYEIPDEIKKRIDKYTIPEKNKADNSAYESLPSKTKSTVDAYIKIQILRSEAKRKMLPYINLLRQKVAVGTKFSKPITVQTSEPKKNLETKKFGKGTPICSGVVSGICKQIISASQELGDATIGIFPNASPEFAILYPRCKGMIFLKGGQTSHGAIVAREFQIPALIDNLASGIPDGVSVQIDGAKGEWQL